MKKFLAVLLAMTMLLGVLTACSENTQQSADDPSGGQTATQTYNLVWAATSASSGYYALNVAMADIINKYVDGVTVTVMETGGTADDYKYMRDGQASFGQCTDIDTYCLQNDMGTYAGYDYPDARMLCLCFPLLYYMTVSEKSGISCISDLNDAEFSAGLSGSSTERDIMSALDALGVTPNWYPASTADAVEAMKNRQIDGFCKSGSAVSGDSSIADVKTSIDIDCISWTEEEQKKVLEAYPYFSFSTISGDPVGLDHDITSISKYFGFCIGGDISDEVAYEIFKAIDEHQDYLHDTYAGLGDYDIVELTATVGSALLHPGVVKYLQEKGYDIADNRIPN